MVRNLLALLVALQDVELSDSQRYSLQELGNKCANGLGKRISPNGWQDIQAKLTAILVQSPELARRYQVVHSQLQLVPEEELMTRLPSPALRAQFRTEGLKTLGYTPPPLVAGGNNELENIVVEITTITLQQAKPSEVSKTLLPPAKFEKPKPGKD